MVTFLPSLCIAMIGGIHIQTQRLMVEIYEVAVEIISGAMIYIPSFIKVGSAIWKLMGGDTQAA
jgi:hypothetical protein